MSLMLRVILLLAVFWAVAGGAFWLVRANRPTPEKLEAYLAAHPIDSLAGERREQVIQSVANQLNSLDFEQRRSVQQRRMLRGFYESMTDEEKNTFLDETLPAGFRQVMEALNEMTPEKRQQIVDRALKSLEERAETGSDQEPPVDEEIRQKIVSQGLTAFYEDANADVKLDFAPVIEQIQRSLQWRD